ncbi:MAG: hypothetical protein HZA14_13160 [Nitrospirae bacterium]|nr:hypothetical protein [Nitrospirota bacterium]
MIIIVRIDTGRLMRVKAVSTTPPMTLWTVCSPVMPTDFADPEITPRVPAMAVEAPFLAISGIATRKRKNLWMTSLTCSADEMAVIIITPPIRTAVATSMA